MPKKPTAPRPARSSEFPPLTDGEPLRLCPALAAAVGVNQAIVLERVWWRQHAPGRGHVRELGGRRFVFYPQRFMLEDLPLKERTLRRVVRGLLDARLLLRARVKDSGGDACAWLATDRDAVARILSLFDGRATAGHAKGEPTYPGDSQCPQRP